MGKSGLVEFKEWTTDSNPCKYCAPLNGTIIPIGKTYIKNGTEWLGDAEKPMKISYGSVKRPPLHVNCECSLLPVFSNKNYKVISEEKKYINELEKIIGIGE